MTTQFLKALEARYTKRCHCDQLETVTQVDADNNAYEILRCTSCHAAHSNKIYHQAHHHSGVDPIAEPHTDSDAVLTVEDATTLNHSTVYRTPKRYRARYRTINSTCFITLRNDEIEFSGDFCPQTVKLIRANKDCLLNNVTVSVQEFMRHIAPSGAQYE